MAGIADLKDGLGNPVILTNLASKPKLTPDGLKKKINEIDSKKLKTLLDKVEKITGGDIQVMEFSIFDYQGFNPETVIKVMMAISEHYGDTESIFLSDIRFSIAANLYMGNLQDKARTKRTDEGKQKLTYLCDKYSIVLGSTGTGIAPEVLTFPRIASAFPVLAVTMASVLPPKTVNLEFKSRDVPDFMRLNPFCSLCSDKMPERTRRFLLECSNAYSADMSIAYEKGRLKKAKREIKYDPIMIATDQWSYAEIASNSPVPDESSRVSLILRLNLPGKYSDIATVVRNYRAIIQKKDETAIELISQKEFEEDLTEFTSASM